MSRIDIRVLEEADIDDALRLTRAAGWNQNRDDWRLLLDLPHAECLAAEQRGRLAGTAVALHLSSQVGWISMVLVDPLRRRQGVGTVLMRAVIEHLKADVPTTLLDATPAGAELYRPLGFVEAGRVTRMRRGPAAPSRRVHGLAKVRECDPQQALADGLGAVDEQWASYQRSALWQGLASRRGTRIFLADDPSAGVDGYALLRPGHAAVQIGPVVTPEEAIARRLVTHICGLVAEPMIVDVPDRGQSLSGLLESLGFRPERNFARMRLGPPAQIGPHDWATAGPDWG